MNSFKQLYINFLNSLRDEISSYKEPDHIWLLKGSISNTPGNLCLHICGNLNHFFGAVIGNTGYIRERDQEFSKKNLSREELLNGIEQTKIMIGKVFDDLTPDDINKIYPINKFGENVTYGFLFSRLVSHLSYHLGQINYHRRITDI